MWWPSNWNLAVNTSLNSLHPIFRPMAVELLARCVEAKIPVLIVNTLRTPEEQLLAISNGTSKVDHSKHQDGLAIDIVPYSVYALHGPDKLEWRTEDPIWLILGRIGGAITGIRWGGTFTPLNKIGVGWDPGHFEYSGSMTTVEGATRV